MKISKGVRSLYFNDFFPKDRIEYEKCLELAKTTHVFYSEIPFGNFGLPFIDISFPENISVRGDKINLFISCVHS